jgi:2-dehydropantoate 2-reductase
VRAGHAVTMVARGARLEALQNDPAIEDVSGVRAQVEVATELDQRTAWDLVLVTVLAHQVDAVLPSLKSSAAKTVMFMFNTFEKLDRLRDAVGADRFVMAFPTVIANFEGRRLKSSVNQPGQMTSVGTEAWAQVFADAKIRSEHEPDMESFLRSHVAWVLPLMAIGCLCHAEQRGLTWAECRKYHRAMRAAFALVRQLGNRVIPSMAANLDRLPGFVVCTLYWITSRISAVRLLGAMGPTEARGLIDAIGVVTEGHTPLEISAIRP